MYRMGELIELYRRKAGLTQAELARRAGCSQAQLQRIECGERGCSLELLSAIAHILGIGPQTLGGAILVYEAPPESQR